MSRAFGLRPPNSIFLTNPRVAPTDISGPGLDTSICSHFLHQRSVVSESVTAGTLCPRFRHRRAELTLVAARAVGPARRAVGR
jgi:hypothetical protein